MSADGVKKSSNPWVSGAAGCIAGAVEALAVWPMEFIKTQLQLQTPGHRLPYTGVMDGLAYTVRTTGFLSLYRGLSVTLVMSAPKAGIRFGGNAYCKSLLADENGKLTSSKQFLAGVGAGVVEAVFAVTPVETIKTQLIQTNQGLVSGIRSIVRERGVSGLYQGLSATIMKQASNQGLRFMFFNWYKEKVVQYTHQTQPLHPIVALWGGMLAGCFSTIGNNPFDVIKTRMQGKDAHLYKNTLDCVMKMLRSEGVQAFYKGLIPRLGRVVPGQGVIFMSFESIQSMIETHFIATN
jgi:solute carrier family 25 citrate transporter 1